METSTWHTKYRPKRLSDVVGQDNAVREISGMLTSKQIPSSIMFFGPSGVGKTTLARLMLRYLNCATENACGKCESCQYTDNHPDLIEINAAVTRGLDDVRALIQQAKYMPRFNMRVIILDELQGMTSQSLQALLLPMEAPPKNTIYCVCTTDPQRLPTATLTRLTKISLGYPSKEAIVGRLAHIAKREKQPMEPKILEAIADASSGFMREAISMLQSAANAMSTGKGDLDSIISSIHSAGNTPVINSAMRLLLALYRGNSKSAVKTLLLVSEVLPFVNQCIWFNQYLLGKLSDTTGSKHVWESPQNKEFLRNVFKQEKDGKQLPISRVLDVQRKLVHVRSILFTTAVPEVSILLAYLGSIND